MRIGNAIIDTDNMTPAELTPLIDELRKIRACKQEARAIGQNFGDMLNSVKSQGYRFTNRDTGEILNPSDWLVYCEEINTIEEWE